MGSLHVAAVSCSIRVVISLLHEDIDIDVTDKDGKTAVDLAAEQGMGNIVELLVAIGAKFSPQSILSLPVGDRQTMKKFVKRGKSHLFRSHSIMTSLVTQNTGLVKDIGRVIAEKLPGIDLLLVLQ